MAHRNARLTVYARRLLVARVVDEGRPVAHVVQELGCSRATGYKWLARWHADGEAGLQDRPSVARHLPGKTPAELEARVCRLRADRKLGPRRLAPLLGMPASTVHAVLTRHGLAWDLSSSGQTQRAMQCRDRLSLYPFTGILSVENISKRTGNNQWKAWSKKPYTRVLATGAPRKNQ